MNVSMTCLAASRRFCGSKSRHETSAVAVAHSILLIAYHMLSRRQPYRELGGNYFDERKRESVTNRLVRRLEKSGYQVALETQPGVAAAAA